MNYRLRARSLMHQVGRKGRLLSVQVKKRSVTWVTCASATLTLGLQQSETEDLTHARLSCETGCTFCILTPWYNDCADFGGHSFIFCHSLESIRLYTPHPDLATRCTTLTKPGISGISGRTCIAHILLLVSPYREHSNPSDTK